MKGRPEGGARVRVRRCAPARRASESGELRAGPNSEQHDSRLARHTKRRESRDCGGDGDGDSGEGKEDGRRAIEPTKGGTNRSSWKCVRPARSRPPRHRRTSRPLSSPLALSSH